MNLEIIANFTKQSDPVQQKIVLDYFESFKSNPNGWRLSSETLSTISDESAIFFCLHVIDDYVKTKYEADSIENNLELRRYILQWFDNGTFRSNYLQNKYAYIVNSIFLIDFPRNRWDSFFKDFLVRCSEEIKYSLFLRILIQINLDLVDRDFPRTDKEIKRNTFIKNVMRETALLDLAQFWFGILTLYKSISTQTVLLCLETISAYVSWIDINLITNASTMSSLFMLFSEAQYRCGVIDCFNEILRKGMDPRAKTQIIEDFMNIECIKGTIAAIIERRHVPDQAFVEKFARLVNTIGIELIEAYRKEVTPGKNKPTSTTSTTNPTAMTNGEGEDFHAIQVISRSIESKYNLLCRFLDFKDMSISYQVHSFTKEYLQWIRVSARTNEIVAVPASTIEEKVLTLLAIIIERNKLPADEDMIEDDYFNEYRKSTKVIFDNLNITCPKAVFTFVCDKLVRPTLMSCATTTTEANGETITAPAGSPTITFAELELALYYFCMVGEIAQLVIENGKTIEELMHLVITSSISNFPNSIIQTYYFDLLVRFEKCVNNSLGYLFPQVLRSFLDERGLCNADYSLRSKVCKMFKKFLVRTKFNCLEMYVDGMLERLQELLKPGIAFDDVDVLNELGCEDLANSEWLVRKECLEAVGRYISTTDQLQIYEIIAFLVVSNPSFEVTAKREMMGSVLKTVWTSFETLWEEIGQLSALIGGGNSNDGNNNNNNLVNGTGTQSTDALVEKRLVKMLHLAHCINAFSCTTKSYSSQCTMKSLGIQQDYLRSLNLFLNTYTMAPGDRSKLILQSSIRQYLHRLILCLPEEDIVPMLPNSLQTLFFSGVGAGGGLGDGGEINARSLQEFIPLLQQIVIKFKAGWIFQRDLNPFVAQIFGPLVVTFFRVILETSPTNQADKVQLQKSYYTFLHIILTNQLLTTFFDLDAQLVEQILGSLVDGLVNLADVSQICIQSVTSLIDLYAKEIVQPAKQSHPINACFMAFIYKSLVPALFLVSSRASRSLLTDALTCLRRLHQLLGEELVQYLRLQFIPEHFKSISNIEDLIVLILVSELKSSMPTIKQVFAQFS